MTCVLLIEPDHELRIPLSELLSRSGFQTIEVGTASAAIEVLRSHSVDVIVLEPYAADRESMRLLDAISELGRSPIVPVLILTRAAVEELESPKHPAVRERKVKPVTACVLAAAIRRLLR